MDHEKIQTYETAGHDLYHAVTDIVQIKINQRGHSLKVYQFI